MSTFPPVSFTETLLQANAISETVVFFGVEHP